MTIDLTGLIKSNKIFSSLDDATLKKLKFDKIYLRKNKILFHQGELSGSVYILVFGKLANILKIEDKEEKIIGTIQMGETVGELSALSHEPRSMTTKALENSILLKLSSNSFRALCKEYPTLLIGAMDVLVERSRHLVKILGGKNPRKKHAVIIPANKKISLHLFFQKLNDYVQKTPGVTLLSDDNPRYQDKNHSLTTLQQLVDDTEKENEVILYVLNSYETLLAKVCFKKIDLVYIVGNSWTTPSISRTTLEKIKPNDLQNNRKTELILIHEPTDRLPQHTSKWLKLAHFDLHHHIRIDQDKDWQRMLRFIQGQAIGVVLGGGGVRSWAHIGALKALMEAGIPIDAIGGTSGGAVIAGYYAIHETYEDPRGVLKKLSAIARKTVSLCNITWPAISFFSGKSYTREQKKIFSNTKIEDLWLPYFCISCNLSHSIQAIHRNGHLWKKVRSSTAVPGIFPPVVIRGELHLDGGLLNNLPVDAMKKIIGNKGTIIAVELTRNGKDQKEYNFPAILTFWQTMLAKLGFAYKEYRFPNFVDTFLNSLLAGSYVKQTENSLAADVLISPDLTQYRLLQATEQQERELTILGYRAAVKAIKKWRREMK